MKYLFIVLIFCMSVMLENSIKADQAGMTITKRSGHLTDDTPEAAALRRAINEAKNNVPDALAIYKEIGEDEKLLKKIDESDFLSHIDGNMYIAVQYLVINEKENAFKHLEKAVNVADANIKTFDKSNKLLIEELYANYARAVEEKGFLDKAQLYYKKAIDLASTSTPTYFLLHEDLGICLAKMGKYDEALKYYTKANEYYIKKKDLFGQTRIYNCLSYQHYRMNNKKECLENAVKVLKNIDSVKPYMKAAFLDTVACAYCLNQDYAQAEKYRRMAIQMLDQIPFCEKEYKVTHYLQLAEILELQGKTEEAQKTKDFAASLK